MRIIRLSESPGSLEAFSNLADQVRRQPYRTGLLPAQVWNGFVLTPTPFAKEFWIALNESGSCVARIGASLSPTRSQDGAIGFFECDLSSQDALSAASALLETAEEWLKAKGVRSAIGPMNFNTWFPYRFRTGEPKARFSWEPENPPEYLQIWEKAGYRPLESYHSQGHSGLSAFSERLKQSFDKAQSFGFTFRPFDSAKVMEQEVPILFDISMEGFRDNFLFEPIPFESFRALYVPIAGKMDLGLSFIASHAEHGPVGFFFTFQDGEYAVFKSVAVKPIARGRGVSNALMYLGAERALSRGLSKLITAMVKSGAQSESYGKKAELLWQNDYVLLKKHL